MLIDRMATLSNVLFCLNTSFLMLAEMQTDANVAELNMTVQLGKYSIVHRGGLNY